MEHKQLRNLIIIGALLMLAGSFFMFADSLPYLDILITIIVGALVLSLLIFIHEGGHYLAAKAFGVRVTEFMLGLPGPRTGFRCKETRFGVTAIPLGGYARVCGMEAGTMSPYLKITMQSVYQRGQATVEDIMSDNNLDQETAQHALNELVEWGTIIKPKLFDEEQLYKTPAYIAQTNTEQNEGDKYHINDIDEFFSYEYNHQYRSLPTWKRLVILAAGPLTNLVFALILFMLIATTIGVDVVSETTGETQHITVGIIQAFQASMNAFGMMLQSIANLFNPMTAREALENSTSIIGIIFLSREALDAGLEPILEFIAAISASLGLLNLLPIPPLDGGRFIIELVQRVRNKPISAQAINYFSYAGIAAFLLLFIIVTNQDIHHFILGD